MAPHRSLLPAAVLVLLGLAAGGCAHAPREGTAITRLWTGYRDARSFIRLSEYQTGVEDPGEAVILRTHPEVRDGFYFSIRLSAFGPDAGVPDGRLMLHVVAPDAAEPRTYTLPFAAGGRRSVLLLAGLTGPDWTHGDKLPLAWKVEVTDGNGRSLASRQSFLWEKPRTDATE